MNREVPIWKYAVVAAGTGLTILAIVFGSLLPFLKAQKYITAVRSLSQVRSLDQFRATFDHALDFYSPVGAEETGKFLGNEIFNAVNNPQQQEEISRALVAYIEPHLLKDNVRHLLLLGRMHYMLWLNFKDDRNFASAEQYFLAAHAIGPRLPNPMYGLLELYEKRGDQAKVREFAEKILSYWPSDGRVRAFLQ